MKKFPPGFFAMLAAGIFLAGFSSHASAQAVMTTLFSNGPTSNRVNVVLFAEGYKTNQSAQFLTDAAATVSNLLSTPPYNEYTNYFNAYAISVASVDSGSDHFTPTTNLVNTYFNSSYDYGYQIPSQNTQRLITIPPNDKDATYNNGKGKIQALLTNQNLYAATNLLLVTNVLPQLNATNRFIVLVVNDSQYGGSGQPPDTNDSLPFAVTSLGVDIQSGVSSFDIIAHESGHTLAGLADEYTNAYAGLTPVERPNATTNTVLANVPWKAWIINGVPVPTPSTSDWTSFVGVFTGAQYHATSWYRPRYDCKMNHLGVPFCEVCSEAIVKGIYQKLRAVDALFPPTNNPVLTSTQAVAFSVTRLQPNTHNLLVQWFTNGVIATGQTNTTFDFATASFTNGNYSILAAVRDNTSFVRNDPSNYLSNTVAWNVTVGISSLRLVAPKWLTNGQFSCTVTGVALNGFVMLGSTNFTTWTPLSTNALTGGAFNFTNNPALPRRFYRALAN